MGKNRTGSDQIRCPCRYNHSVGEMIQCDRCHVWQHFTCVAIKKTHVPESYVCERCSSESMVFDCPCGGTRSSKGIAKCNKCHHWQHLTCVGVSPSEMVEDYRCLNCRTSGQNPRPKPNPRKPKANPPTLTRQNTPPSSPSPSHGSDHSNDKPRPKPPPIHERKSAAASKQPTLPPTIPAASSSPTLVPAKRAYTTSGRSSAKKRNSTDNTLAQFDTILGGHPASRLCVPCAFPFPAAKELQLAHGLPTSPGWHHFEFVSWLPLRVELAFDYRRLIQDWHQCWQAKPTETDESTAPDGPPSPGAQPQPTSAVAPTSQQQPSNSTGPELSDVPTTETVNKIMTSTFEKYATLFVQWESTHYDEILDALAALLNISFADAKKTFDAQLTKNGQTIPTNKAPPIADSDDESISNMMSIDTATTATSATATRLRPTKEKFELLTRGDDIEATNSSNNSSSNNNHMLVDSFPGANQSFRPPAFALCPAVDLDVCCKDVAVGGSERYSPSAAACVKSLMEATELFRGQVIDFDHIATSKTTHPNSNLTTPKPQTSLPALEPVLAAASKQSIAALENTTAMTTQETTLPPTTSPTPTNSTPTNSTPPPPTTTTTSTSETSSSSSTPTETAPAETAPATVKPSSAPKPARVRGVAFENSVVVVSDEDIESGAFVMEFEGCLKTKDEAPLSGTVLPHAMTVPPFVHAALWVDGERSRSLSRFIRRSCSPSCVQRLYRANGELRLGVFAARALQQHEEVTVDFDYSWRLLEQPVSCVCGNPPQCVVALWNAKRSLLNQKNRRHNRKVQTARPEMDPRLFQRPFDEHSLGMFLSSPFPPSFSSFYQSNQNNPTVTQGSGSPPSSPVAAPHSPGTPPDPTPDDEPITPVPPRSVKSETSKTKSLSATTNTAASTAAAATTVTVLTPTLASTPTQPTTPKPTTPKPTSTTPKPTPTTPSTHSAVAVTTAQTTATPATTPTKTTPTKSTPTKTTPIPTTIPTHSALAASTDFSNPSLDPEPHIQPIVPSLLLPPSAKHDDSLSVTAMDMTKTEARRGGAAASSSFAVAAAALVGVSTPGPSTPFSDPALPTTPTGLTREQRKNMDVWRLFAVQEEREARKRNKDMPSNDDPSLLSTVTVGGATTTTTTTAATTGVIGATTDATSPMMYTSNVRRVASGSGVNSQMSSRKRKARPRPSRNKRPRPNAAHNTPDASLAAGSSQWSDASSSSSSSGSASPPPLPLSLRGNLLGNRSFVASKAPTIQQSSSNTSSVTLSLTAKGGNASGGGGGGGRFMRGKKAWAHDFVMQNQTTTGYKKDDVGGDAPNMASPAIVYAPQHPTAAANGV